MAKVEQPPHALSLSELALVFHSMGERLRDPEQCAETTKAWRDAYALSHLLA